MINICRIALFIAFCFAVSSARAGIREVQPGEIVNLDADEGLLVLSIDTNYQVSRAGISPLGKTFGDYGIARPEVGLTTKLLVASAGTYGWNDITLGDKYFPLRDDADYTFTVAPGVINYPGNLIIRLKGYGYAVIHVANRSLAHLDFLAEKFPDINAKYEFKYSGKYPDPFPSFYKNELKKYSGRAESRRAPFPELIKTPLSSQILWKTGRIRGINISPGGQYISQIINLDNNKQLLRIIDIATAEVNNYSEFNVVDEIKWVRNDAFIISYNEKTTDKYAGDYHTEAVEIAANNSGKLEFKVARLPRDGYVVDAMLKDPDWFLFANWSTSKQGVVYIHKVNKLHLEQLKSLGTFNASSRLNTGLENDRRWLTNSEGEILAAILYKDGKSFLSIRDGKGFRVVRELPRDDAFLPVAISEDSRKIYVITDEGRNQRDLVEVDVATNQVDNIIFSKYGVDVDSVIYDTNRQPAGVNYYLNGQLVSEYLASAEQMQSMNLSMAFPESNIRIIDKSLDSGRMLIYVDSSVNPGTVYLFDSSRNMAENIDDDSPWLSEYKFSKSRVIKVKTSDNLQIEGYLTLPENAHGANFPLVVMPHGGPIGIRDDRHFNREVQFIASLGYAVLQVNFRGSDGFGKNFVRAGKGSFGSAIENDIDAMTTAALRDFPLDKEKMCIIGSSYGGYSALVSVMRWPERFKCAISLSGSSDRILSFSASDSIRSETARVWMEQYFGNPLLEADKMISEQPLYGYERIVTPLMLIHGTEDFRVDYENAVRLQRMLSLAGRPPVMLTLKNEGHGNSNLVSVSVSWDYIAAFLNQHLGSKAIAAAVPVDKTQTANSSALVKVH